MAYLCTWNLQIVMKSPRPIWVQIVTIMVAMCCMTAIKAYAKAEAGRDSLEVSLLTCTPGQEVYEVYGHTAIRIYNTRTHQDLTFNYGVFSFGTPHFVWRFIKGETDYCLGVVPTEAFVASYTKERRGVTAQVLNLTQDEAHRLYGGLIQLAMQPDWTYRYNFLYDNCTTRAIADVERCIDGEVAWPTDVPERTFRQMITEFAAPRVDWNRFGQDLLIGAEADRRIGLKEQLFSPIYTQGFAAEARIRKADGTTRPLVKEKIVLAEASDDMVKHEWFTPLTATGALFLLCLALTAWGWRRGRALRWADNTLLLMQGVIGLPVAFLFLFSTHPTVGSNMLILWLNPLPLLYLPWKIWRNYHQRPDGFGYIAGTSLLLAVTAGLLAGQHFPAEVWLLMATYATRVIHAALLQLKQKNQPCHTPQA